MYATIEQAKEYIENYYGSTDLCRTKWEQLSDQDKQVLLNRAEQAIDQLPLLGKPLIADKAFPRQPFEHISLNQAKIATIELALNGLNEEANARAQLQKQGVHSFRIGDLSETFITNKSAQEFSIVFPYLQKWLGGGYTICNTRISW